MMVLNYECSLFLWECEVGSFLDEW